MKRALGLFLVLPALACGGSSSSSPGGGTLTTIAVEPSSPTLAPGASLTFSALGKGYAGGDVALSGVTWSSSDATIATIGATSGVATGVKAGGPVTITAAAGSKTGTAKLTVAAATSSVTIDWGFAAETTTVSTTVTSGTQVQWHNTDGTHSIVPDSAPPPSSAGPAGSGATFGTQAITAAPGTYTYHCGIHPSMHGQLVVQ